eukprot:1275408-Prymnesium_polylepis.1
MQRTAARRTLHLDASSKQHLQSARSILMRGRLVRGCVELRHARGASLLDDSRRSRPSCGRVIAQKPSYV